MSGTEKGDRPQRTVLVILIIIAAVTALATIVTTMGEWAYPPLEAEITDTTPPAE